MGYSDKVQAILAPTTAKCAVPGRGSTCRFVLLGGLPTEVSSKGQDYRIRVECEPVSHEWRLFGADLACERAGHYRAWLMATAGSQAELDRRMYSDGIESNSGTGTFEIFKALVRDGRAKEIPETVAGSV